MLHPVTIFACATCDTPLTTSLSRVARPDHTHQTWGHCLLGSLMASGTYAIDPVPSGWPWRSWSEIGEEEAAARGWYTPVHSISEAPANAVLIAPGDTLAMTLIPGRLEGSCCGLDGGNGPNVACERCTTPIATRIDDCGAWQVVRLDPRVVRAIAEPADDRPPTPWEALAGQRLELSRVEREGFNPAWSATTAVALAHLLDASGGRTIVVPDGPIADVLGGSLAKLLPPGSGPDDPGTGRPWPSADRF